jgi:hypothetical protein
MNEGGGLMELIEGIEYAKGKRLTQAQFLNIFAGEDTAKSNGKANGRKHPKGNWVQEDTYELTINTMFCDGPPCMWTIAHDRCRDMQNNFLFNTSTFLRRKYPENWDKALEYINYNVLQPVGDREKLNSIVKRAPSHNYQYLCDQEPICAHCNPYACRRMPYGVGDGKVRTDFYELGLVVVNREPRIYFANLGDKRIPLSADELLTLSKFRTKCLEYGADFPAWISKTEWDGIIRRNLETAVLVEPSPAMRTNAFELEILTSFFSIHIPSYMRVGEKSGDAVRVREEERRIYFKWQTLARFIMRSFSSGDVAPMRKFVDDKRNCDYHTQGPNFRGWFRCAYSVSFDKFDAEDLGKWFGTIQEEE